MVRTDIGMTNGKSAAQAGHAFLAAFLKAHISVRDEYVADEGGTKVVLVSPDEATIWQAYKRATDANLPCHLWTEFMDRNIGLGNEIVVTALGIGPVERCKAKPIVGSLKLMP